MKVFMKELLDKKGYKDIEFKEPIFDMENFATIIAYNFTVINKDKERVLISVELEESTVIIWESLEGLYDGEDWEFIGEVERPLQKCLVEIYDNKLENSRWIDGEIIGYRAGDFKEGFDRIDVKVDKGIYEGCHPKCVRII